MIENRKHRIFFNLMLVITTAVITFSITSFAFLSWYKLTPSYSISFNPESVSPANIKKFNDVRNILKNTYYKEVDENKLIEGAIAGMADSLEDPYTVYLPKEQMQSFMETAEGSYSGIGVSVNVDTDGLLTIVEAFEGSPALAAGMKQGDKIIKVDDTDVTTIKDENVIISMIKGPEGTKVKITIYRPSEGIPIEMEIERKRIKIENIKSEMLPGNIGYIKIVKFDGEIDEYFEDRLNGLIAQGMKGLIIDVRDNPGGSYDQVVAIADRLIPEGVIVYTEDRAGNRRYERSDSTQLDMPMAVLINENSASASEILAGAIKDNKKGILVGEKTFGKGLVQTIRPLDDGSGLKVTISRYFTPSDVCIQDIGIEPDVKISLDEKYRNVAVSQIPREDDTQLSKAIEVIKEKLK